MQSGIRHGVRTIAEQSALRFGPDFAWRLGTPALQTLSFVTLVFAGQALIYAIRGRPHLWSNRPSLWLIVALLVDVTIACTLALGGFAVTPLSAVVVGTTLAAKGVFALLLDAVK